MELVVKQKFYNLQNQIVMNKERSGEFFNSLFVKPLPVISAMSYLFEGFYLNQSVEIRDFWKEINETFSRPKGFKRFIRNKEDWEYIYGLLQDYPGEDINEDDLWEVFRKNPIFNMREANTICILETELRKLIKN